MILLGAIVVVGAWFGWRLLLRDTATPVSPPAAPVTSGSPGAVEPPLGEPGIYVFATTGSEQIDALAGAGHDYPVETLLTLSSSGCGLTGRWQPLEERWDTYEICSPGHGNTSSFVAFHQWFGQPDLQEFSCDGGTWLAPEDGPRAPRTLTCSTEDRTEVYRSQLVGRELATIAARTVDTVHVRTTSTLTGATAGESRIDIWWISGTALPARIVVERESVTDSIIGEVTYRESYDAALLSTVPRPDP
ncbi:MAG: hypothetical protein ACE5GC_00270 [Acidimicrobiia bacterium]